MISFIFDLVLLLYPSCNKPRALLKNSHRINNRRKGKYFLLNDMALYQTIPGFNLPEGRVLKT